AQFYARPAGARMQILVRVPLAAMRDVEFPETPEGYLDVERLAPLLPDAATLWIAQFVSLYDGDADLGRPRVEATQISLPSTRAFAGSFDEALKHVTGPRLPNAANVSWNQVMLDVLLEWPVKPEAREWRIHSRLAQLAARVLTVLRFVDSEGQVRVYQFSGDPGRIALDPSWSDSAALFVKLGFGHILDGIDHLLFLLCLVIPCRRVGRLLVVVTAFTIAHSVTLMMSALQLAPTGLWFPPLVEMLIAASIVYMAVENIVVGDGGTHRRWMVAFGFGLVHGFGFSFALQESLQFAGRNLLSALLAFNVGVELGQIFALALMTPLVVLLFRYAVAERLGVIVLSAFVAHTGWHWLAERWEQFRRFEIAWPSPRAVVVSLRWLVLILVIGFFYKVAVGWWTRKAAEERV
ncbi:MAG TPA: HupE/UreJ family protein, partial [Bryobacteraceae bacterium]|nr:HupE/UreJ family protein [Bryobacteraceae bacterium]